MSDTMLRKDDANNNEASTDVLDDLTKQLMEALDTNEVIGDKEEDGSPFGNDCFTPSIFYRQQPLRYRS